MPSSYFNEKETDIILAKIDLIITKKIDDYFKDRLESEIRNAVRSELNRVFLQMKGMVQ